MKIAEKDRLPLEALLFPTPLARLDPAGEAARRRAVRADLGLPEPAGDETNLLERCARDAFDAQIGRSDLDVQRVVTELPPLIHPLGGGELAGSRTSREEVEAAWQGVCEKAHRELADREPSWPRLWHAVVQSDLRHVANSPELPDHSVAAHRSLAAALVRARQGGDEAALLLVQVGPVQEFIEASRRTHDLWGGSFLMSWFAWQAVQHLAGELGPEVLLTPRPEALPIACKKLFGQAPGPEAMAQPALPAKVLAVVPLARARELAEGCAEAIRAAWRRVGEEARQGFAQRLGEPPTADWSRGFEAQLDAFLERDATWVPWPEDGGKIASLLASLDRSAQTGASAGALYGPLSGATWDLHRARRKAILPAPVVGDVRLKCTVCGAREQLGPLGDLTPLREFWKRAAGKFEGYQIKTGEGLCAVCLSRRFARPHLARELEIGLEDGEGRLNFPSVPTVASWPFRYLLLLARDQKLSFLDLPPDRARALPGLIGKWIEAARKLPGAGAPSFGPREALGQGAEDPLLTLDGAWLDEDAYEQPRRAWYEQNGTAPEGAEFEKFSKKVLAAAPHFLKIQSELGIKPSGYVAVLYLDGDRMSAWLNGMHESTPTYGELWKGPGPCPAEIRERKRALYPALQAEISDRLSQLASGEVARIVARHLGRLVYCGGDDVLALLPLATAIPCAVALRERIRALGLLGPQVTVSAGLAIFQQRDPLSRALVAARRAEKLAKKTRDRLAVHLALRSGEPQTLVLGWEDAGVTVDRRLYDLAAWKGEKKTGSADSPLDVDLAYRLREELRGLPVGRGDLLWERLRALAGLGRAESLPPLFQWLREVAERQPEHEPDGPRPTPEDHPLVRLLLLARFLHREAHGLPLDALLQNLPAAENGSRA